MLPWSQGSCSDPRTVQRMLTKALTEKLLESQLFVGAVKRGHSLITEFAEGLREGAITGPPPGPSSRALAKR